MKRARVSGGDSKWHWRHQEPARPVKLCRCDEEGIVFRTSETDSSEGEIICEMNRLMGVGDTPMSEDPEGDMIECDAGPADWNVRIGQRNSPTQKKREDHEANHAPFRDWCSCCMTGRERTHYHTTKTRCENHSQRPPIANFGQSNEL